MDARRWTAFALAPAVLALSTRAPADCPPPSDTPECTCYVGSGDWPLAAVAGDVIATAKKSRFAKTSCRQHAGQPYWQIQRQIDSPVVAHFSAHLLGIFGGLVDLRREAWCTETVAFWHREAGVPYADGYARAFWHPSSFVTSVRELSRWYAAEEFLEGFGFGGRGRWIDGQELDYANFEPGVNGPCPGAYQAWLTYNPSNGAWSTECTHSQVVDSVLVWRIGGATGDIERIDVHVIEGNASDSTFVDVDGATVSRGKVRNDRWYNDVFDYTSLGDSDVPCDTKQWKIYGWGIDLRANGTSYCDESKIGTVVTYLSESRPPPQGPNQADSTAVAQIVMYAASTQGSVVIASNSPIVYTGGAWPTPATPWVLPAAPHPVDPVYIDIDLLAQHPIPVNGIVLDWENGRAPNQYEVWWAAADQQIHTHPVTLAPTAPPPTGLGAVGIPTGFGPMPPYAVRYLRLCFPNGALTTEYRIAGVHLLFETGEEEEDRGDAFDDGLDVLVAAGEPRVVPGDVRVLSNRPNPFASGTWIEFTNPGPSVSELAIYDVAGRRVRRFEGLAPSAGRMSIYWDGRDARGAEVASGVYFVELRAGDDRARSTVLLRR